MSYTPIHTSNQAYTAKDANGKEVTFFLDYNMEEGYWTMDAVDEEDLPIDNDFSSRAHTEENAVKHAKRYIKVNELVS